MDPNETLKRLREEIADIPNYALGDSNVSTIAELFNGLDHWLSSGGFLPAVWMKHRKDTL